ncbi:MAG: beta-ketoacyl synthase chain length factor [Rhodospirillales bacterium]|nr:beta-ketoacyl synthase chain length factor [Rhodospirillales bacterium]
MPLFIGGVGLMGPGLSGWPGSLPVLQGRIPYQPQPVATPTPALLAAGERRRATAAAKLVLQVGEEALSDNDIDVDHLLCVFASASGELSIVDNLCRTLCSDDRALSPTQFHNSVHNASAGYWSIATGSGGASVSLSAFDDTFAAGLLEAAVTARTERVPVLFVACDLPAPEPLRAKRPLVDPFAVALLLLPQNSADKYPSLSVQTETVRSSESTLADAALERLRRSNPAARCLPLIQAIATGSAAPVRIGAASMPIRASVAR